MDDLNRALYFGVAAVQSQGIEKGEVFYQIRADQEAGKLGGAKLHVAGRGIGAPNAGPGGAAYAGIAYEVTTEEQGRKAVQELADRKVNVVKIWVDDRTGVRRAWRQRFSRPSSTRATSMACRSTPTCSITPTPSSS
jgi:hypothetical protein